MYTSVCIFIHIFRGNNYMFMEMLRDTNDNIMVGNTMIVDDMLVEILTFIPQNNQPSYAGFLKSGYPSIIHFI